MTASEGRARRPRTTGGAVTRRAVLGGAVVAVAGCLGGGRAGTDTPAPSALDAPTIGDPESAVTVAVYEDFSCPHCATFNREVFPRLREEYIDPGTIRYEHHDFPIPVDSWSWPVASAARAVQDGADDRAFFAYAQRLYENLGAYSLDAVAELARSLDVDSSAVRSAAEEETYRAVVAADRESGVERGVAGTPTVFVNEQPLTGPTFEAVGDAIEAVR